MNPGPPHDPTELRARSDLFAQAQERPPGERAAFLAQACPEDEAVRQEVVSLLQAHGAASDFLGAPVFADGMVVLHAADPEGRLRPGDELGDCRVVSLLGEGGMGEVYLAQDTRLERPVAVKLLKRRLDDASLARRFRHERRVLAALTHPNIARLYGGGVTPEGRSYLVMEYVEGERLDKFCESRRLGLAARLALFRKVCAAVAYAHQNLVVHRDLKPANLRVTPEGEPKLLDFGIAKLLDPEGNAAAMADPTLTMQGAMTPEYASPEQLKGEAITTSSDVYSLGVVLYELLCGQRPFAHLKGRRLDELARAICEEEPPLPSTVLKRQKTEGGKTRTGATANEARPPSTATAAFRLLPAAFSLGDLDNIVAKALRKEPARRYPGVTALSEDIRRYGEGLPVSARRDTLRYRAGKFVQRNKVGVAAATLIVLALVVGLGAALWQAHSARLAQQQTQRLNEFLQKILRSASPDQLGKNVKVTDVLDATARTVDQDLANDSESLLQAHLTLARTYGSPRLAGRGDDAVPRSPRVGSSVARRTIRRHAGKCRRAGWRARYFQPVRGGRTTAAAIGRLAEEASSEPKFRMEQPMMLAHLLEETHRLQEAERYLAEAQAIAISAFGRDSIQYVRVCNVLGNTKRSEGDFPGALAAYQTAIEISNRVSPNNAQVIPPELNVCIMLFALGQLDEMRTAAERAEQDCRRIVGEKSLMYAGAVALGALDDFCRADYAEAMPKSRRALALLEPILPPEALTRVQAEALLGPSLTRLGQPVEGEPPLRAAYDHGGKVDKIEFVHTIGNLEAALGECLLAQKRYVEAEPLLLTGFVDLEKRLGPQNGLTLQARQHLHDLYLVGIRPPRLPATNPKRRA